MTALCGFSIARNVLAALMLCLPINAALAQDRSMEYAVKATYLYKFVPFVDWPAQSFGAPDSPLYLCVAGSDPFGALLDRAVENVVIGQRHIEVKRPTSMSIQSPCHVLFIGGNIATVKRWLAIAKGHPILTVTELDPGGEPLGIINFVTVNSRVRFAVDNTAAVAARLKLSTKLLALATTVTGASP